MSLRESRNARAFASAQRAWDNMVPDDEPEPDEDAEQVRCVGYCPACGDCEHADTHGRMEGCERSLCKHMDCEVECEEA